MIKNEEKYVYNYHRLIRLLTNRLTLALFIWQGSKINSPIYKYAYKKWLCSAQRVCRFSKVEWRAAFSLHWKMTLINKTHFALDCEIRKLQTKPNTLHICSCINWDYLYGDRFNLPQGLTPVLALRNLLFRLK